MAEPSVGEHRVDPEVLTCGCRSCSSAGRWPPRGWCWIFIASIVISVIALVLILGTPESKVATTGHRSFDTIGLIIFMITVLAMM